jgi:hypothetical protein
MLTERAGLAKETSRHTPQALHRQIVGGVALAGANMVAAVSQLGVAVARNAAAGVLDATHNILDGPAYFKQFRLIAHATGTPKTPSRNKSVKRWEKARSLIAGKKETSEADAAALERSSYAWIAAPALGAMALAGYGLVQEVMARNEPEQVGTADYVHIGSAGLALMIAGGLYGAGRKLKQHVASTDAPGRLQRYAADFHSHAKLDVASSAAAVVEAVAHTTHTGVWAINTGVMAIAGYQAWRFWPSRLKQPTGDAEYQDGHHHDHDHCGHVHLVPHELTDKGRQLLTGRRRKVAALTGVLATVLGFGLAADASPADTTPSAASGATAQAPRSILPPGPPPNTPNPPVKARPLFECVTAVSGDSQWRIAHKRVSQSTDAVPSRRATNAMTLLMAYENRNTNPAPDNIQPGQCIQTPTPSTARNIYDAVMRSEASETKLGVSLAQLNSHTTYADILQSHDSQREIRFALAAVAS